jgi:hypothetical protein
VRVWTAAHCASMARSRPWSCSPCRGRDAVTSAPRLSAKTAHDRCWYLRDLRSDPMASRFVRSDGTGLGEKVAPGATKAQPQRGPSPLKATTNTLDSSGRSALLAQPALMREDRLRAREDANGGANGKAHVQGEESGAGECLRFKGTEHNTMFEAQTDWGVGSKPNNKVRS